MSSPDFKKKTMDELQRLSAREAQQQFTFPIVIVLDNVRSMHNVGSVFRTADSFVLAKCGVYNGIENPLLFFRHYFSIPLIFSSLVSWKKYRLRLF